MKKTKTIGPVVVLFCVISIIVADAHAWSLVWTCPSCGESFSFPSSASSYRDSFAQRHLAVCRPSGSSSGTSYGGGTGDPTFDAMMPMLDSMFQQMGKSLAETLFGNPEEDRRRAEMRRLEQERLQEGERQRREEMARIRRELHQKLLSELMLLDTTGDLPLMTLSSFGDLGLLGVGQDGGDELELMGIDDGLRPAGTSFFGLGGGPGNSQPGGSEVTVKMSDLRRAAYLVQKAQGAEGSDAELLVDEGMKIAQGQPAFVAIDDSAVPVVSEDGLLAFQKANNDYRRSRDLHLQTSERFAKDDARYERARTLYEKAKAELEQAVESGDVDAAKQRELMNEVYERLQELRDARMHSKAELESAESDMLWAEAKQRRTLSDIVVPEPSVLPGILEEERRNLKPSIAERLAHMYEMPVAEKHDREYYQIVEQEYGFSDDPVLKERVERLTERVRALSPYPDEPSRVRIVDRPADPNLAGGLYRAPAVCTSDTIYFGIEYLEKNPSDDEIMFIAGHEMAHVQRGHHAKYILSQKLVSHTVSPDDLIDWDNTTLSDEQIQSIRQAAYDGALHDLNHEQELEADRLGFFMAISAGAKPGAIREAFDDVSSRRVGQPRSAADRLDDLTSTHPEDADRVEQIRRIYGRAIDKAPIQKKVGTVR